MKLLYILSAATATFAAAQSGGGFMWPSCEDDLRRIYCDKEVKYEWPTKICYLSDECKNCFEWDRKCNRCVNYIHNDFDKGALKECKCIKIEIKHRNNKIWYF